MHDSQSTEGREGGLGSLDDELNAEVEGTVVKEKEIKKKPRESTTTAEGIVLQQNLNIANASIARLEQRCLDLLQENLGFKSIIDETEDNKSSELHPFQVQARKLESLSQELDEVKSKFLTASTEARDLTQRLEAASGKGTLDPRRMRTSTKFYPQRLMEKPLLSKKTRIARTTSTIFKLRSMINVVCCDMPYSAPRPFS
jgi:predicted  nucleic acid-binding Zn-ribbon protein